MTAVFHRKSLELEDTTSCLAWPQTGSLGPWANQSVFLSFCFLHWKMEMPFLLCRAYQEAKMRQYLGKDVKAGRKGLAMKPASRPALLFSLNVKALGQ